MLRGVILFCLVLGIAFFAAPTGATDPVTCTTCDKLIGVWKGYTYTRARSSEHNAFPLTVAEHECIPDFTMIRFPTNIVFQWKDNLVYLLLKAARSYTYDDEAELTRTFKYYSGKYGNNAVVNALTEDGLELVLEDGTPVCLPAQFDFSTGEALVNLLGSAAGPIPDCSAGINFEVSCSTVPPGANVLARLVKQ